MRRWPHSSHPSMWPPSAAVRQVSMADMTLSWARLICPAWAARQAGPAARKTSATSSDGRIAGSGARALSCHQQLQVLERTGYRADRLRRDTGIKRRRVELGMSQEDLNDPDVDVLLEKMRSEAVTQGVGRHALADAGRFRRLMDGAIDLAGRDRLGNAATGKQPAMGRHDVPPPALAPPEPKQLQELRRQHRVAVLAALALLHPYEHAGAVDVVDLEGGDLRDPKPGAIGGPECRLVLETRRRLEQPPDLLDAQHVRKLAGVADQDETSGQIRPVERHGEEEAQRRHRAVDGRRLHPALGLISLETTDILGRRRIRRPHEEGGEAPHEANVVALRVLSKAAYRHVLKHALTQRAHGLWDGWLGHRVFLSS